MSDGTGAWTAEARQEQRELRDHIRGWIVGYRMDGAGPWTQNRVTARSMETIIIIRKSQ